MHLVAVIGVFSNGMAYLMSFVYGMVYFLAQTGALVVMMYVLVLVRGPAPTFSDFEHFCQYTYMIMGISAFIYSL